MATAGRVSGNERTMTFQICVEVDVDRPPDEVYAVVSDLRRSGEWSTECTGGSWVSGEPATVGAVFRGDNFRAGDVVSWAPVARGHWSTEAQVVAAEPGVTFCWAMRDSAGRLQESVWGFDIEPRGSGSLLIHHFRMGRLTEGMRSFKAQMSAQEQRRFLREWGRKLERDVAATLERIKAVIEQPEPARGSHR
jgi:hypothetical protein